MKWYEKLDIIKPSLLAFFAFLVLSYLLRLNEWWPELFLIIAEAALSIVIVLKIIEVWSRRERSQRWEKVELLVYSEILDNLLYTYYWMWHYIISVDVAFVDKSPDTDKLHEGLYNLALNMDKYEKSSQLSFRSSTLAANMKTLIEKPWGFPFQLIPHNFVSSKKEHENCGWFQEFSKNEAPLLDRLMDLLIETKMLIPNAIQLSNGNDYELGFYLHEYGIGCNKLLLNLRTHKRKQQESATLDVAAIPSIIKECLLVLKTGVNLCEIITKKLTENETSWKDDLKDDLKYWWLPPPFWK
jgi:hypothetical protein